MSDLNKILDELNSLTVEEAVKLVRMLEKEWNVSSTIQTNMVSIPYPTEPEVEEQTEFDVILKDAGQKKIEVIKSLRMLINGLGLMEAKKAAETSDFKVFEGVSKQVATDAKNLLEKSGAVVEII